MACAETTAPSPGQIDYALTSIDGAPLPYVLVTDYDVRVSVVSDVISLRSDSTFQEVAVFRGVSDQDPSLSAADTVDGTYSVYGDRIYFLQSGAQSTHMTIDGETLTQQIGARAFVYRRR